MDEDLLNFASFLCQELSAVGIPDKKLYRTGNMMANIRIVQVGQDYVDIVIATDYASYTNTRGKWAGWVEKTIREAAKCYAENNNVEDFVTGNIGATLFYGG